MARTESSSQMQKSGAAPPFILPGIDGRTYDSRSFKGKEGLFVLFMCNHCPYVKARIADAAALYEEFGNKIAFVGINSNDPDYPGEGMENMKEFAKERGIGFPYLLDEDGATARAYGATCTPDPFLFDSGGNLVFHGRITDAQEPQDETHEYTMRENMRKLLAGEPISQWFNPSLGCSIKFKGKSTIHK